MPVGDDRVYGLKGVISLVRDFMTRTEQNGELCSDDQPVLVVEGFHGTGKSALISTLDNMLGQVPHARIDLETHRHASVPEVLSAAAFDLSRTYPKYELQFPRFIVGQLAARLELDLTDHSQAYKQVETALEQHRNLDTVRQILADTAGSVLASAGLPVEPPASLIQHAVTWLTRHSPARKPALGTFQTWYSHRDLDLHHDPIDVLIDLNRWSGNADDALYRQGADDLLLAAFLADLRLEFAHGRRADERSLNAVLLLDNADTVLGRRFLGQLVHARRRRAVGAPGAADPLTVVATSRGRLLAEVPEADRLRVVQEDLETPQHPDWSRYRWVGYGLPDLTEDEVGRAIADMGLLLGQYQRLTRVVHELTCGHPASTSLVLEAIAHDVPRQWIEPEALLAHTERRDQPASTVAERILDRLLPGVSDTTVTDLVTCAPARRRAHGPAMAERHLLAGGLSGYTERIDPLLWPAERSAGRTVLRRLLTRRLAERTAQDAPDWSDVHAALRRICRETGDEEGDLYHALADGELNVVATHLHRRLLELDCPDWHDLVLAVGAAPRRPRTGDAPVEVVRTMVDAAGLEPEVVPVGRLVAALHVATDPFTDSRRSDLHLQIADDWSEVGRLRAGGPHAVFLEAARHHRREADWWD